MTDRIPQTYASDNRQTAGACTAVSLSRSLKRCAWLPCPPLEMATGWAFSRRKIDSNSAGCGLHPRGLKIFQIHLVCIVFRGQTMQMRKRICFRGVWRSSRAQQLTMPRHSPLRAPTSRRGRDSAVERRDQRGHRIRNHDQKSVFTCSGPDIHHGQTSLTRIERVVSAVQSEEPRKFCCHFLAIVFSLAAQLVGLWSAVALRVTTSMSLISVLTWGPKNKIRGG